MRSYQSKEEKKTRVILISLANGDKVVGVNAGDVKTYGKLGNIKVLEYAFLISLEPFRVLAFLDTIEVYYSNVVFVSMLDEGNPIYERYIDEIKRLKYKNLSDKTINSFRSYEGSLG